MPLSQGALLGELSGQIADQDHLDANRGRAHCASFRLK